MAWDGPILTDSGGFQVFSLRDTIAASTTTASRSATSTTARDALHARARGCDPGEPRQRHRDVPRPGAAGRRLAPRARGCREPDDDVGRAPARRAARRRAAPLRDQPGRRRPRAAAPLDGGDRRARLRRQRDRRARDRRGPRARCSRRPTGSTALLPAEKPRYFMGIGDAEGILEVIEAGVDMFDCVLPTRTARTGSAMTAQGGINLRNARFARDAGAARRDAATARPARVHARLHPPPREPERAARAPPPLAPQSTLPPRAHPRRARRYRARRVRVLQTRPTRKAPMAGFLILIVLLGAFWVSSWCPPRRRRASHPAMQETVEVGDEVITAGGIHGAVREVVDEDVQLEIAPGVVVSSTGARSRRSPARSRSRSSRRAGRGRSGAGARRDLPDGTTEEPGTCPGLVVAPLQSAPARR